MAGTSPAHDGLGFGGLVPSCPSTCSAQKIEVSSVSDIGATLQTAQRNSLRLLQWMMAASVALPLALFIFASSVSWVSINETADREIERTLDVAHEHALKVFETIDRSLRKSRKSSAAFRTRASGRANHRCISV